VPKIPTESRVVLELSVEVLEGNTQK